MEAVKAVSVLGTTPRANVYRRMNEIPMIGGTAVNVQAMVSAIPATSPAQALPHQKPGYRREGAVRRIPHQRTGEDVVAGVRTPPPISHLKDDMPEVYQQFSEIADRLEKH